MTTPDEKTLHAHEIPKYYQSRVLAYLFRHAADLKTRSTPEVPVRMEVHEYFNMRTYNAVKSAVAANEKLESRLGSMLHDPLNSLFMSIGLGEYDYVFTGADGVKHVFDIDFHEECKTRTTSCDGITYFRRLVVRTPTPASFVEFYKLASEIDNTSDEKLRISVTNKYSEWNTYSRIPVRRLNTVYMDERVKERIMADIREFLKSEDEYDAFGIPYKKTYLLTGVPGSGKTSLIKALCNEIHYNLGIMSMSRDMDNATIQSSFRNIDPKTVLLLEDIDCLFEKRTSVETPSFTFSNLLNILDGVLFKHGLIVFITTNHPEKLDPALLRQGRTDLIVELNYPSRTEIEKLFRDMLGGKHYATAEATTDAFKAFYAAIKDKQLPMSAIVNFLFRHRDKHMDNLKELLDGDSFIKRVTGEETSTKLYA
jgi:predicted AAA+ superfamily ATPase